MKDNHVLLVDIDCFRHDVLLLFGVVDKSGLIAEDARVHAFVFVEFEGVEEVVLDQVFPQFFETDAVDHFSKVLDHKLTLAYELMGKQPQSCVLNA